MRHLFEVTESQNSAEDRFDLDRLLFRKILTLKG